jgi:hypothetical protein
LGITVEKDGSLDKEVTAYDDDIYESFRIALHHHYQFSKDD